MGMQVSVRPRSEKADRAEQKSWESEREVAWRGCSESARI